MAGKGYSFAGSKIKLINLEKQKKDLEENIKTLSPEDQLKTQQEINNINDQLSVSDINFITLDYWSRAASLATYKSISG